MKRIFARVALLLLGVALLIPACIVRVDVLGIPPGNNQHPLLIHFILYVAVAAILSVGGIIGVLLLLFWLFNTAFEKK